MEHNLIKILDNVEIGHEENLIVLNNDVYFFCFKLSVLLLFSLKKVM